MKAFLMTMCAFALTLSLPAQEKNFIDQNYIEVNGRAQMEVAPDEIYLDITLSEQASKGKVTLAAQEKELYKRLKGLGVNLEKDLTVQDQMADYQAFVLRKNVVLTTKTFKLKVNSATMMSRVFAELAAMDVSDVNVVSTDVSNMEELRQEVRASAAKAAQQNAQVLASAVGRKVGNALYIQDYGYNPRPYANMMLARASTKMDSAMSESAPELEFTKIVIEHSVTVRFSME